MKNFGKLALLGAAIAASVPAAHATSINGALAITGQDTYTTTDVQFNKGPYTVAAAIGSLSPIQGASVTLPADLVFATPDVQLLLSTGGGVTASFTITGPVTVTYSGLNNTIQDVSGTGYFTETGYDQTSGTFDLSSSTTLGLQSFEITAGSATPEPSSLMLLGTGLVSGAGMLMRRRRVTV